jgi:hypothetical protein
VPACSWCSQSGWSVDDDHWNRCRPDQNRLYKEYGGQSLNLKKFWDAVDKGMSYEDAAFETITGQWAKANDYTTVEFVKPITPERVEVIFKK